MVCVASPRRSVSRKLPGPPDSDSNIERNGELHGRRHLVANDRLERRGLSRSDLKEQFVVDLHEEARLQAGLGQGVENIVWV